MCHFSVSRRGNRKKNDDKTACGGGGGGCKTVSITGERTPGVDNVRFAPRVEISRRSFRRPVFRGGGVGWGTGRTRSPLSVYSAFVEFVRYGSRARNYTIYIYIQNG